MSTFHSRWLITGAIMVGGCAGHTVPPDGAFGGAADSGVLPTTRALDIDVGVSYLRLTMEARDSVSWSLEAKPQGCAVVKASPGRLEIDRRDKRCTTRWDVRIPIIEDVKVRASVGDIDVSAPADRAIRLRSGVGSVRFRLDGRELRGGKTPGSGDQIDLGDVHSLPRLDVETGVGWVHGEIRKSP